MSFGRNTGLQNVQPNASSDIEISSPPSDGISCIKFSPAASHLSATSWDNKVYCWEIQANGQSVPKAATDLGQPVLCSDWSPDGATIFAGGLDNQVTMWSLATNQKQVVAKHDAAVRYALHVKDMSNMLVTGSWDRTVRYWDLRQPNPVHTQQMPERVYAMDIKYPMMAVGMAARRIQVFNLANPAQTWKDLESPLKHQTRCIAIFPDAEGYMIGSIEGRVAVQYALDETRNFTFKCHRDVNDIYAVNSMCFHPIYGTFVTAGGDGTYSFWDKDSKQRLKAMPKTPLPIASGSFNKEGTIYAYALSYEWSRGCHEYNPQTAKNTIMLHALSDSEVQKRPPAGRTGRR